MAISGIIAFAVPIFLARHLLVKEKVNIKAFFIGAGIFIIFALLLEQAFHLFILTKTGGFGESISNNIWYYAIYGGLAAGIFEEVGRYIGFSFLLKKEKNPNTALMYGLGHGGTEAILLVGIVMINNIIYAILINHGSLSLLIKDPATLESTLNSLSVLSTTPALQFLMGGVERISAIILQVSLSVLVFMSVKYKRKKYLFFIAILLHAIVDFAVIVLSQFVNIYLVELVTFLLALSVAYLAYMLYMIMKNDFHNRVEVLENEILTE
jgi:uncharacterized membrane protein YhfC